jgi:PilZ domain-containing protein
MADKPENIRQTATSVAKDRRADQRYKFTALAVVVEKKSGRQVESRVSDLSPRGCFVSTDNPFPVGTNVTLRITKGTKSFEAGATVVSSSEGKGMGLFFASVDPVQSETLGGWLMSSLETSWLISTRRKSQRLFLRLPIKVAGHNSSGSPFEEKTHTQAVSAHGALVLLSAAVNKGQHLVLTDDRQKESVECVVAHIGDVQGNFVQVGVAFRLPNPKFWKVTFPAEDWSARHPDAK